MLLVTSVVVNAFLVLPVFLSLFVVGFECLAAAIVRPMVIVVVVFEGKSLTGVVIVVFVVIVVLDVDGYVIPMQIQKK